MSFADVKKGQPRKQARAPAYQDGYQGRGNDLEGERLRQEITSNLTNMDRKVNETKKDVKKLGTKKDTTELRERLEELGRDQMSLREATLHMIKSFKAASGGANAQVEKLSGDFASIMQKMQEAAREQKSKFAEYPQPTGSDGGGGGGGAPGDMMGDSGSSNAARPLLDAHRQEQMLSESRLNQNEEQIMLRESQARRIESDVADIAEIMKDLAVVVHSQTELIDNIETNVENTVDKTAEAGGQLMQAEKHQQGNRKLMCCLFQLLLLVVVGLVLILIFKKPKAP